MSKISIVFIIDVFCKIAGAERNLFELVTRLNPEKYRPIIICLEGGELVEDIRQKGYEIYDLRIKRIYSPQKIMKAIWLFKLLKQKDVKIVVTYHESSDFWGCIIARICRIPVIISSRRDMGYHLKKRHFYVYRLLNNFFDKILTVSDAVKELVFLKEKTLWHKLTTIYNGVELEKFSQALDRENLKASLGIQSNRPVIGILAALRPIKGHKYFLEASSIILKEFPEACFLIVGWYDEGGDYYKELKNLTRVLNIEKKVIFTGGRSDIPEILSIIDISAFSSINEGFSNAILESMAAGKPVVATNTGGTPEAVIDGKTGILVPPCNARALANAILKLLHDKKLSAEMGMAGRKRVEEFFTINKMIKEIENLYVDLLEEKIDKEKSVLKINKLIIKKAFLRILKLAFSFSIYYSGLFVLIKKICPDKGIKIITYHRISNDSFDPLGMNISVENFEMQIRYLKKNYNLVSLEQAVALLKEKRKNPNNTIAITFDDGYRDNLTNAYPIIKKYQTPATIFLSVEAIEKGEMLWFDLITDAFKQTTKEYLDLGEFNLKKYILHSSLEKNNAAREAVLYAKNLSIQDRQEFIEQLLKMLDIKIEDIDTGDAMLNWKDINDIKNDGITFGSHGMSHSILTNLSLHDVEYEIEKSMELMNKKTGKFPKFFAYPNGQFNDFNQEAVRLLEKHGYIAGFTLIRGSNNGFLTPFALRRLCINEGVSAGLSRRFSRALFAIGISGLFELARRRTIKKKNENIYEMYFA